MHRIHLDRRHWCVLALALRLDAENQLAFIRFLRLLADGEFHSGEALAGVLGLLQRDPQEFLQGGAVAGGLDEAAITARGEALFEFAIKIWPGPK